MFDKQRANNLIDDVTVEVQCATCGQWIASAYAWIYPTGEVKCIICSGKRINLLHWHTRLKRKEADA